MDSKAVFTQEFHREAFMGLCINVFPLIEEIIKSVKKSGVDGMAGLLMDMNGYISFDIHNSSWRMVRIDDESPAKIQYSLSDVEKVPEISAEEKAVFGHVTENIMEITLAYADLQISNPDLCKIDSTTWKRLFVDWANEFESQWQEDEGRDYLAEIDSFARRKILEYLK